MYKQEVWIVGIRKKGRLLYLCTALFKVLIKFWIVHIRYNHEILKKHTHLHTGTGISDMIGGSTFVLLPKLEYPSGPLVFGQNNHFTWVMSHKLPFQDEQACSVLDARSTTLLSRLGSTLQRCLQLGVALLTPKARTM